MSNGAILGSGFVVLSSLQRISKTEESYLQIAKLGGKRLTMFVGAIGLFTIVDCSFSTAGFSPIASGATAGFFVASGLSRLPWMRTDPTSISLNSLTRRPLPWMPLFWLTCGTLLGGFVGAGRKRMHI